MRHPRHRIRGQAMGELVIICIPLLMIFVIAWLFTLVGRDKIQLYIENRGQTDETAMMTASTGGGRHIVGWDYGEDGIPFTNDDTCQYGDNDESGFFSMQLNTDTMAVIEITHMLRYDLNNFIMSPLFAAAAELCSTTTRRPVLQSFGEDRDVITRTVKLLFGKDLSGDMTEEVFMPAMAK